MADDDHLVAAALDGFANVVDSSSGRQPLVGNRCDVEGPRDLAAGLARPEKRARENDRWNGVLTEEALPERPCLFAACRREWAQLVGLAWSGLGMSDEVEAHRTATISAWVASAT